MRLVEKKGDLFKASDDYFLAHCISADYALGAGIAKKFNDFYCVRDRLKKNYPVPHGSAKYVGKALLIDDIFNLVTKRYYYQKPTFDTLESALIDMRTQCEKLGIKKIAMPRIASGLDRLPWDGDGRCVVKSINRVFEDTDIDIVIYSLEILQDNG